MAVANDTAVRIVMEELGVSYTVFDFPDETAYYDYVEDRWNRVERLIDNYVGAPQHDEVAFPEQFDAHVYWTAAEVLLRKRITTLISGEQAGGGFTIGRFTVDSAVPTLKEHKALYDLYRQLALDLLNMFLDQGLVSGGAIWVGGTRPTPWANRPSRPPW